MHSMNGMLAAMEDASGTIIIATAILAVALIVFAFLIGGEPDFPDGSVEAKEEARSRAALREGDLPPDGADLWRQFVAERRRSQDLEASIASFHDQLHMFNPMTPYRYAQLHDQIHRDLEAHGISVEVSVQEEVQDLRHGDS
jgi:hypothetical protein